MRRAGKRRSSTTRSQRDFSAITDPGRMLRPSWYTHRALLRFTKPLIRRAYENEDRRRFHPDGKQRSFLTHSGIVSRIRHRTPLKPKKYNQDWTTHRLGFADAYRTIVCTRRKVRRIALFAKGRIGRGIQLKVRRKLRPESSLRC